MRAKALSALASILFCATSQIIFPLSLASSPRGKPVRCSCPMCTTDANGVHHCPCCKNGGVCRCGETEREDAAAPVVLREMASLPTLSSYQVLLAPGWNMAPRPVSIESPDLPVPTPPPKA